MAGPIGGPFPRRLVALSVLLGALLLIPPGLLDPEGLRALWRYRAARDAISRHLASRKLPLDPRYPFLGVDWSITTTTQGELGAKRLSHSPIWALRAVGWFKEAGLKPGDRIAIFSSSSFPALLASVICAAEAMDLRVTLVVSLGASSYGANRPEVPWPDMEEAMRSQGAIRARSVAYTLGGDGEVGGGIPEEGLQVLLESVRSSGIPLWRERVLQRKLELVDLIGPRLVVSIGGSAANLGSDPAVLDLPPGLVRPPANGGDGLVGMALNRGIPVLHLINLEGLNRREARRHPRWASLVGLLAFASTVWSFRRWRLE